MARSASKIDVYLEVGKKRTFSGAIEWPGWCRSGRDKESALQALLDYAPRYGRAIVSARLGFRPPSDLASLIVVEQLPGTMTTDFGAPEVAPSADARPVDDAELKRLQAILKACWRTFDGTVKAATGKELRKGPRGGGRDLEGIVRHVLGGDEAYLSRLGGKVKHQATDDLDKQLEETRQAMLKTLTPAAHGEIPAQGPRGGARWTPRYFVRRAAWHVLDHAWEIEDRVE